MLLSSSRAGAAWARAAGQGNTATPSKGPVSGALGEATVDRDISAQSLSIASCNADEYADGG